MDEYGWIDESEMLDLVAIAQSAPGAIAVNGAIVVGYKLAGASGALVSIAATILPPFVIISLISLCYEAFNSNPYVQMMLSGMQSGVGAVIAVVVYEMGYGIVHAKEYRFHHHYVCSICGNLYIWRECCAGCDRLCPAWCNQDIAGEEEGVVIYIKLF